MNCLQFIENRGWKDVAKSDRRKGKVESVVELVGSERQNKMPCTR